MAAFKQFGDRVSRDASFLQAISRDEREARETAARLGTTQARSERADAALADRTSFAERDVDANGRYRVIAEHGVIAAPPLAVDSISGAALLALQSGRQPGANELQELRRMMRALLLHYLGGRGLNAWRVLKSPAPPADPA